MSKKFKFELNKSGVGELLKGDKMGSILEEITETVRGNTGGIGNCPSSEYKASVKNKGTRLVGTVSVDSRHAYYSNMKHNTLLKALRSVKRS